LLKKKLKTLMMQLHDVCIKLKDKNEIDIIRKYGWNAQRFTTIVIGKIA
jgi:hypothetical protein